MEHGFSEGRLLRFVAGEMPTMGQERPESLNIRGSLRTLESSVYERLVAEADRRGFDVPQGAQVECSTPDGPVRMCLQPGHLVQGDTHGTLLLVRGAVRFVPHETFQGEIAVLVNGQRRVLRAASAEPTLSTRQVDQRAPEVRRSTEIPLPKNAVGIRTASGETLTFRSGETGTIRNSLGTLTRPTNRASVTFTPAVGLQQRVFAGEILVYDPTVPANSGTRREVPPQPVPRRTPAPSTRPPQVRLPEVRPEGMDSTELSQAIERAQGYLRSADAYRRLGTNVRWFLRLYVDHGPRVDAQGLIARELFMHPAYRQFETQIASPTYQPASPELERLAGQVHTKFVLALAGPEDLAAERNEYIGIYNRIIRQRQAVSMGSAAEQILDPRYRSNPRGRFDQKIGRVPEYRSPRTAQAVVFRTRRDAAFRRLATCPEADAAAVAREYRANDYAFTAIRGEVGRQYEQAWGSRDRGITMQDGSVRDADVREQANAFFEKHLAIDMLMLPQPSHADLVPNRTERERAEERLRRLAPDYPTAE